MDFEVDITVQEIRGDGICPLGHRVGDVFHIGDAKLCPWAGHTLMPFATALRFGGEIPWKSANKDEIDIGCPDPNNVVVFRLTRKPRPEGSKPAW